MTTPVILAYPSATPFGEARRSDQGEHVEGEESELGEHPPAATFDKTHTSPTPSRPDILRLKFSGINTSLFVLNFRQP